MHLGAINGKHFKAKQKRIGAQFSSEFVSRPSYFSLLIRFLCSIVREHIVCYKCDFSCISRGFVSRNFEPAQFANDCFYLFAGITLCFSHTPVLFYCNKYIHFSCIPENLWCVQALGEICNFQYDENAF